MWQHYSIISGWLSFWVYLEWWSILWRKRMVPKWFSNWFKNFDSHFVMLARHSFTSRSFSGTWCPCILWAICSEKDWRLAIKDFRRFLSKILFRRQKADFERTPVKSSLCIGRKNFESTRILRSKSNWNKRGLIALAYLNTRKAKVL